MLISDSAGSCMLFLCILGIVF
uniref:Uncharacterized protein n=1 Tax=Rhizophora mucronata TaxID=61149 RepID=A0A2P2PYD7_RHIMU